MNPSDDDDPRIGEVVAGRYRILMKIGRGGMGSVYEAEHLTTLKRFAIKVLLPGLGRVPEIARRFEREARASSVLNHPNIVNVVDFGTLDDDATLYLVMEYVPGRSLGDVIDAGRVPALRGIAICRQVLEALAHAHAHGVVHRDLKPDNIMLLDAGRSDEERDIVKLLDFGIAKVDDKDGERLTQAGVAFGTPDYMAPEQALGEEVDARADLYALGVILFEILAGRRPFESGDKLAVLRMHVALSAPALVLDAFGRAYCSELVQLCATALEKRREDRFPDAPAMIEALDIATMAQAALEMKEPSAHLLRVSMARPAAAAPLPSVVPGVARSEQELELDFDAPFRKIPRRQPDAPEAPRPASASRRMLRLWIGAAAVAVAAGAVALAVHLTSRSATGPGAPSSILAAARTKSERAVHAEKKLAAGDAAGALATLEAPMGEGPQLDVDPWAQLILGHARFQLDRDADAIAAYQLALSLAPDLAADVALRVNLAAMVGRKDRPRFALQALELAYARLGPLGHALVTEHASRGKAPAVRKRAREMAEERGLSADVDWVGSYSLDLTQGATCKERREAIPKLRGLRDKKAIPPLKRARDRRGGFLNLADVNDCLDRDAQEAIDFLQALP